MKYFTLTLIAVFCSIFSHAQQSGPISLMAGATTSHTADILSTELPTLASLDRSAYYADYMASAPMSEAKCGKYKKMKTVGIILSGIGGGLIVGGAVMAGVAVHQAATGNGTINTVGLAAGGYVMVVFGVFSTGAGIPLAVIGSVKQRKYCSGASSLELHTGQNGAGLALNF